MFEIFRLINSDTRSPQLYNTSNIAFIKIIGKGDKERLVPIGQQAIHYIYLYLNQVRIHQTIQPDFEDFVFLNRRGKS